MKTCSKCSEIAATKQGHQWLCERHYRFGQMRSTAARHGKSVPSHSELESLVPPGMLCPVCKRKMNWMAKQGHATVVTLQHDRSGARRMLCLSCNVRHASFSEDSFYVANHVMRVCPRCKRQLPRALFGKDNKSRWLNTNTYCQECRSEMHQEWVNRNREKYNENRRAYYHRRIAEGNPIPR
jgi:hypothetical protein